MKLGWKALIRGAWIVGAFVVATVPVSYSKAPEFNPAFASPTLLKMDTIVDQAQSFQELVGNATLRAQLLVELQHYLGKDKLPQQSFDKIMGQLSELDKKIPGFGDELLSKRVIHAPIRIEYSNGEGPKYEIHHAAWMERLQGMESALRDKAKPLLEIEDVSQRSTAIADRIRKIQAEISKFQKKLNSPEEKALILEKYPDPVAAQKYTKELRDDFNQRLKESSSVREIISYAVYQRLTASESTRDALRSGDGVVVLKELCEIQNSFHDVFEDAAFDGPAFAGGDGKKLPIPKLLRDEARDAVPNAQKLRNDPAIMRKLEDSGSKAQTFYESHRALYSAFRGILNGECVGGSCNYLENTTPLRTAVPVLQKATVQFAEDAMSDGTLKGFMEMVPVVSQKTQDRFDSLLIGHPGMVATIYVENADGLPVKTSLYELWLKKMTERGKRLVIGTSLSGDNAYALTSVRNHISYQLGVDHGPAASFSHAQENQPMVDAIVQNSPQTLTYGYDNREQMIFDATLPDNRSLTELRDIEVKDLSSKLRSTDPQGKIAFLTRTMNLQAGQKQKYFRDIRFLLEDPDLQVRREAANWVLDGKINNRLAESILSEWIGQPDFPTTRLNRLASQSPWSPEITTKILEKFSYLDKGSKKMFLIRARPDAAALDRYVLPNVLEFVEKGEPFFYVKVCQELKWDACVQSALKLIASEKTQERINAFLVLKDLNSMDLISNDSLDWLITHSVAPALKGQNREEWKEQLVKAKSEALQIYLQRPAMGEPEARRLFLRKVFVNSHGALQMTAGQLYLAEGNLDAEMLRRVLFYRTHQNPPTFRPETRNPGNEKLFEYPHIDEKISHLIVTETENDSLLWEIYEYLVANARTLSPQVVAKLEKFVLQSKKEHLGILRALAKRGTLTPGLAHLYIDEIARTFTHGRLYAYDPAFAKAVLKFMDTERVPSQWLEPFLNTKITLENGWSDAHEDMARVLIRSEKPSNALRAKAVKYGVGIFKDPQKIRRDRKAFSLLAAEAANLAKSGDEEKQRLAIWAIGNMKAESWSELKLEPEGKDLIAGFFALLDHPKYAPVVYDALSAADSILKSFPEYKPRVQDAVFKLLLLSERGVQDSALRYLMRTYQGELPFAQIKRVLIRGALGGPPTFAEDSVDYLKRYYTGKREGFEAALQASTSISHARGPSQIKLRETWIRYLNLAATSQPLSKTDIEHARQALHRLGDGYRIPALDLALASFDQVTPVKRSLFSCVLSKLRRSD